MLENREVEIEQEEINNNLLSIAKMLRSIPSISLSYMEYISALIYAMYENKDNLKIKSEKTKYVLETIDYELRKIRDKEKSEKLFRNIKFLEILNDENDIIFEKVLKELNKIILKIKNKQILANAFEYIIMEAAQNNEITFNNKEYYTPQALVETMVKLLNIKDNMAIYNPASGTGNFITESAKHAKIYAFGEEEDISNYNICITNLWLHDIYNKRIKVSNSEQFQEVDIAIANPPFVDDNKQTMMMYNDLYYHYGISPNASSYAKYLTMMLNGTHRYGKIAIVLPHGFLFKRNNKESWLRRKLIDDNYIDAIIGLPEKLFYNTKIPVIILIIDKAKKKEQVLFIDASKEFTSKRKNNVLTAENVQKIIETYQGYKSIKNYSYVANVKEIKQKDYDLNINKYIQVKNETEKIDKVKQKAIIENLEIERKKIQEEIKTIMSD